MSQLRMQCAKCGWATSQDVGWCPVDGNLLNTYPAASRSIMAAPIARKEIALFTPDEIQTAMDKNLAAGLRQLADALEAGTIDGRCVDCQGHGGPLADPRAHVLLRIDLAAAVVQKVLKGENNVSGSDQGE